ncbi:sensor histidine kinase [Microbacterium ulmi]|uniref:histidine kinase n=1 Tax=Microbacterium ulmi TaxID=179095 RepID=A0A7Y2LY84_9MICO|nr:HAMP domain-containing sensor histidine kinase [Microbacterium ulmi]NNH03014.1 HAMP domain-containing protein [Microbacterium ulmi]
MAFLRNTLVAALDTSLSQAVSSDVASGLIGIEVVDGEPLFTVKDDVAPNDMWVALYGPDGERVITAGGDDPDRAPVFPDTITLEYTARERGTPFTIPSADGGSGFRAAVDIYPVGGVGTLFTQLIARPLAPINEVVGTFLGIYAILALITIVGGALLTRWLVTLTFRSLGQVETTAMAIAQGDFSQRLTDIEPTTTEVGRLKTALNTMLGRMDAAITQRDATVRQMRRFIGDASHELRTPLVTVRGWAELYRLGAISGDDDVAQAMDRIESEAKRMGLLVEDLLALARLDERRDVVFGPVDLRPVARDAALDVRATSPLRAVTVIDTTIEPRDGTDAAPGEPASNDPGEQARRRGAPTTAIARAGATLSLLRRKPRPVPASQASGVGEPPPVAPIDLAPPATGPTSLPPVVFGDENRIRQVVANLLGNARRFTAEDSPIELRVGIDAAAGMGWIEVADHGEGVPDQIKDKIFQRFWRADTSRARETGGTGLGLSIVASIVEALHGRVRVKDTPGGGATFHVAFPLASSRTAQEHLHIETQPIRPVRRGAD